MRGTRGSCVAVAVAAVVLTVWICTPPVAAAELKTDWRVRIGAGVDTNPMRVADDGPNGSFVKLTVDGSLSRRVSRANGWFAGVRLSERRYDADADLADRSYAKLRAGWSVRPPVRRLSAAFGVTHELARSTYIDRETGTRQQVDDGAGGSIDVGDRYDRDITGVFFNARYRSSKRTRVVLRSSFEQSSFRADYAAIAGLAPLDATTVSVRPELRIALHGALDLAFGVERSVVDYDERPALDQNGTSVPGATRRYEYTDLIARVRYEPGESWRLRAGIRARDRADAFAGYYDYDGASAYASLERSLGDRSSFTLYGSHGTTDYDNATVSGNGQDEPRGGDVTRWIARFRRELSSRTRLYFEGGAHRAADRDPIYAHDRTWTSVGIEFRQ